MPLDAAETLRIAKKTEKLTQNIVKAAEDGGLDLGEVINLVFEAVRLLVFAWKQAKD